MAECSSAGCRRCAGSHARLHLGNVNAIDVDHAVRRREVLRADATAEMIAAPERDVQAQLLVEQDLAGRLDSVVGQESQS